MSEQAQIEELLRHMLQPNTEVVRAAVASLNKLLKQSQSMPILMELMFKSPYPEVNLLLLLTEIT
jgi:hypothetical protein